MDGNIVVGVLMVVFWLISTLISRFAKTAPPDELEGGQPVAPQGNTSLQQALQELADQMGFEAGPAEAPVASEHTLTDGEHRQAAFETQATSSERMATISEHRRTASEARRTASETAFTASEHELIESEHLRGDLRRANLASKSAPAVHHEKSAFAKAIVADLTGAQDSPRGGQAGSALARAMVLRDILGPPVGLRSPDQDLG